MAQVICPHCYEGVDERFEHYSYLLSGWRCKHRSKTKVKAKMTQVVFPGGMVRESDEDKMDYTLILDGPLFERWVRRLNNGTYVGMERNWLKCQAIPPGSRREEAQDRFRRAAIRHMMQWLAGQTNEDHAAAVVFNINGYELMKEQKPWIP